MHILCTICSDLISPTDNVHVTKCGHIFHHHCLVQWIERSKSCPQCRNKVTVSCMFRIYPTISNESSSEDAVTLQSRLDDALLQLRQQKVSYNEKEKELVSIKYNLKKNEDALKASERKLVSRDSAIAGLREQLDYVKVQNKETQKLKEENAVLKNNIQTLSGLQKVLNATSEEVEQMLQEYTDLRTIATFATALKRALYDSESKKNESRNRLVSVKQQLEAEKVKNAGLQKQVLQLQEGYSTLEKNIESFTNKRKALEESTSVFEDSLDIAPKKLRISNPEPQDIDNTSINTMLNRIENADSPYLNLKQSNIALASMQQPSTLATHNSKDKVKPLESDVKKYSGRTITINTGIQNNSMNTVRKRNINISIFRKKDTVQVPEANNSENNLSYDGLGGHSAPDIFPQRKTSFWRARSSVPKVSTRHKLRRPPSSVPSGSQDIGKMLQKICEVDNH